MSEIPESETCQACKQPTIHCCNLCALSYCHGCDQQGHWADCKCYEVCPTDEGPTFLKATRDIQAGEIVFAELPLVFGPKLPTTDGKVPCVKCCRFVPVEQVLKCPGCSWPLCSLECQAVPHGEAECDVLKLASQYDILLPLRVLFLQNTHKDEWEKLLPRLEQESERYNSRTNNGHQAQSLDFSTTSNCEIFLEELQKLEADRGCSILEQKSVKLFNQIVDFLKFGTSEMDDDSKSCQILYPTAGLISHDCTPNTTQKIDPLTLTVTVRAASPISKNSSITSAYTSILQGTLARLENLKTSKNITCACDRCRDPTEFGTFFSALICLGSAADNCKGIQLPAEPTNDTTLWICNKCRIELPNEQMVTFLDHLGGEVGKILDKESTIEELEDFMEKLLMFLHPNHYLVCPVKAALIKMYRKDENFTLKKIKLCESLIQVVKKFDSGLRLGELLHELFEAKLTILRDCFDKSAAQEELQEICQILAEMKTAAQATADVDFHQTVAEDVSKLAPFLC